MESNIKLKANGWRLKFDEDVIRGLNYIKARDVRKHDGSTMDLSFSIKFTYDTEEKILYYTIYPMIKNCATYYIVELKLISRAFADVSFEMAMKLLTDRIFNAYVADDSDKMAVLHWTSHEIGVEKPSEKYPNDLLFYLESNNDKVESVCIHMDRITETCNSGIEVPVNMCWYDPSTSNEVNIVCHKANFFN